MTQILAAISFFRTSRLAQAVALVIALGMAFLVWLHFHDNGVRRGTTERIEQKAQEQAADASNRADEAAEARNEAYHETRVNNAAGVDDYLMKLRKKQLDQRKAPSPERPPSQPPPLR